MGGPIEDHWRSKWLRQPADLWIGNRRHPPGVFIEGSVQDCWDYDDGLGGNSLVWALTSSAAVG